MAKLTAVLNPNPAFCSFELEENPGVKLGGCTVEILLQNVLLVDGEAGAKDPTVALWVKFSAGRPDGFSNFNQLVAHLNSIQDIDAELALYNLTLDTLFDG